MDGAVLNINSTTYNLNLATLVTSVYGSVLPYTILNVNAPIYGNNGANGYTLYRSHGTTGGNGTSAINFSGFSGKTVKIINNSTIRGGTGGNGGNGAYLGEACYTFTTYGGNGGSGGIWNINSSGVAIEITGNSPINGSNGRKGMNSGTSFSSNCG